MQSCAETLPCGKQKIQRWRTAIILNMLIVKEVTPDHYIEVDKQEIIYFTDFKFLRRHLSYAKCRMPYANEAVSPFKPSCLAFGHFCLCGAIILWLPALINFCNRYAFAALLVSFWLALRWRVPRRCCYIWSWGQAKKQKYVRYCLTSLQPACTLFVLSSHFSIQQFVFWGGVFALHPRHGIIGESVSLERLSQVLINGSLN